MKATDRERAREGDGVMARVGGVRSYVAMGGGFFSPDFPHLVFVPYLNMNFGRNFLPDFPHLFYRKFLTVKYVVFNIASE